MTTEPSPRPDLTTPEGKAAQRAALRRIAPNLRRFSLLIVIAGAGLVLWGRYGAGAPAWAEPAGAAVLVLGWAMFVIVIVRRTLHHRATLRALDRRP